MPTQRRLGEICLWMFGLAAPGLGKTRWQIVEACNFHGQMPISPGGLIQPSPARPAAWP